MDPDEYHVDPSRKNKWSVVLLEVFLGDHQSIAARRRKAYLLVT
jgi:hypothetical protein